MPGIQIKIPYNSMFDKFKKNIVYHISIFPVSKKIWKIYTNIRWFWPTIRKIRKEFQELFDAHSQNPKIIVQLIHDNGCSPPTFGNYLETLLLARYLSIYGMNLEYILISPKALPIDWKVRGMNQNNMRAFIKEQVRLAKLILPNSVKFKRCEILKSSNSKIIFVLFKNMVRKKEINAISAIAIHYLMRLHKYGYIRKFLLSKKDYTKNLDMLRGKRYICINFRKGIWDIERNNNLNLFISDLSNLSSIYPKHSIMILSDPISLFDLKKDVKFREKYKSLQEKRKNIIFQPEKGFTAAARIILGSDFYFQRSGGGLAMIPIFSKIPYFFIMREVAYLENIRKGTSLVPWAEQNQRVLVKYGAIRKDLKYLHRNYSF